MVLVTNIGRAAVLISSTTCIIVNNNIGPLVSIRKFQEKIIWSFGTSFGRTSHSYVLEPVM